jgi:hypothetical protein
VVEGIKAMTIFGKQTIDETRHLMRVVEFRVKRAKELGESGMPFSAANATIIKDWNTWQERWDAAREKVLNNLLMKKLSQPLVSDALLEAQAEFDMVQKAIGSPHEVIALSPIITRFEVATGKKFDSEGQPIPVGFDPDHAAYKKVDDSIKAGEAAAKAAADGAKNAAKSNTGIIVLGAVGIVAVTVVAAKVYL